MTAEHPFAGYIRVLSGPSTSRPLSEAEALDAFRMIMAGGVEPVQLGAFLCLLRETTETPEETTGFVKAARPTLTLPDDLPPVDVDWSAYAGKTRRPPFFLLAALLLAQNGLRILMHGEDGAPDGRLYAAAALQALGRPLAGSAREASRQLADDNFAYLPLRHLSSRLQELISLRTLLGVRTPVHTFVRNLNAFRARCLVIGVAHAPYRTLHQTAAAALGERSVAVFKGDGGEAERRPEKPCDVAVLDGDGQPRTERWPALIEGARPRDDGDLHHERLAGLWRGTLEDPVGETAVVGTVAIVLATLGRADGQGQALAMAREMWAARRPLAAAAVGVSAAPPAASW